MKLLLLPLTVMTTTALGRACFAQANPQQIQDTWLLDLRTIVAVGGVVLLGTWTMARWMKRIDDRLDSGDQRFEALEKNAAQREDLLRSIERKVDRLTCGGE